MVVETSGDVMISFVISGFSAGAMLTFALRLVLHFLSFVESTRKLRSKRVLKFHVLVTTYDDVISDAEMLAQVPW